MEFSITGQTPPRVYGKKNINFSTNKKNALKCLESPNLARTLKVFHFQFAITKQKPFKS